MRMPCGSKRGEHALTMRAVAALGHTTPTLYERFSQRRLLSLSVIAPGETFSRPYILTEFPRKLARVLDFFAAIPKTSLISEDWAGLRPKKNVLSILEAATGAELGGKPDHHMPVAISSSRF